MLTALRRDVWLVPLTLWLAACGVPPTPPAAPLVTVTRPAGSWQGSGNRTIGFVSESGRFRVTWQVISEEPPKSGIFRLTAHSAVSGRPIQLIADHRGIGAGSADVADDPRQYNMMIESANVEWSFSVDEFIAAPAPPATSPPRH